MIYRCTGEFLDRFSKNVTWTLIELRVENQHLAALRHNVTFVDSSSLSCCPLCLYYLLNHASRITVRFVPFKLGRQQRFGLTANGKLGYLALLLPVNNPPSPFGWTRDVTGFMPDFVCSGRVAVQECPWWKYVQACKASVLGPSRRGASGHYGRSCPEEKSDAMSGWAVSHSRRDHKRLPGSVPQKLRNEPKCI